MQSIVLCVRMSECQKVTIRQLTDKQRQTTVNPSADGQTTVKQLSNHRQTTVKPPSIRQLTDKQPYIAEAQSLRNAPPDSYYNYCQRY